MTDAATTALRERLLSKIVMPGPATPCATWVGGYNRQGYRHKKAGFYQRPVISVGSRRDGGMRYVTRLLLELFDDKTTVVTSDQKLEACHRGCPTGTPVDGVYRCVDLSHLEWDTRWANEQDKRQVERLRAIEGEASGEV